jgi:hypothetical protein
MTRRCRKCGVRIRVVMMDNTGRWNFLNLEPSVDGNVRRVADGNARHLLPEERKAFFARGGKAYTSHLVTCPGVPLADAKEQLSRLGRQRGK